MRYEVQASIKGHTWLSVSAKFDSKLAALSQMHGYTDFLDRGGWVTDGEDYIWAPSEVRCLRVWGLDE